MRTKYHQITLKDTFSDCQDMFREDTPSFFQLLNDTLDISEFIPPDFYRAFYLALGRKRIYPSKFLPCLLSDSRTETSLSIGRFSLCTYPSENLFHPFRLSAHPFPWPLPGIAGLLRLLQSSRCPSFFPLQDLL